MEAILSSDSSSSASEFEYCFRSLLTKVMNRRFPNRFRTAKWLNTIRVDSVLRYLGAITSERQSPLFLLHIKYYNLLLY